MPKQGGTKKEKETEEAAEECEEEESEEAIGSNWWDGHVAACQAIDNELERTHITLAKTAIPDFKEEIEIWAVHTEMLAKLRQRLLTLTDID